MSEEDQDQYVSIKDFAKENNYSEGHIRRLIRKGRLDAYRTTERGKWLVKKDQKIEAGKLAQQRQLNIEEKYREHERDLASTLNKLIYNFRIVQRYGSVDGLPISEIVFKEKDIREMKEIEPYLGRCLLKHIQVKIPGLKGMRSWEGLRPEDITDEFLYKLSIIGYQKDFKDTTCDICRHWG